MTANHLRGRNAASRRGFLKVGSAGLFGLSLADILRAEAELPPNAARASSVILVWLDGGPATIDMWDPKPDAPDEVRGEFSTIHTALPGERFSELMQQTARILDRCTLVRSLHHNIPDHVPGSQYVMTGNKPNPNTEHPSVGSLVASLLPPAAGMPAYFCLGEAASSGAGFLGAQYDPFRIELPQPPATVSLEGVVLPQGMSRAQLLQRHQLRKVFDASFIETRERVDIVPTLSDFQRQAFDILSSNRIGRAFELSSEPASLRQLYGESEAGRSAMIARRLIEAGARFVTLGIGGWDTHADNFTTLRQQLPPLDRALAGLILDLQQRGMLDETIVVCGGEFGRTPVINNMAGRDHWSRAISYMLAGGDFQPGLVYGATDHRGFDPVVGACSPDDLSATILSQLGFPAQHKISTTSGRPIAMFESGKVIDKILTGAST